MVLTDQNARILVQVDGVALDHSPWRSYEGGDINSTTTTARPAGQEPSQAFPGVKSRTNVTVTRWYSTDVLHPLLLSLEQAANSKKITISWTPIDGDKNPVGDTMQQDGLLKDVMHPNFDPSNSAIVLLTLVGEMNEQAKAIKT